MKIFLFLLSMLLLEGCFSLKPVTFKQADHFTVTNPLSTPEVSLDMIFENPNSFGLTVKKIETIGSVNNGNLFSYKTDKSLRVGRKSEFTIPIRINMPLNDLLKTVPSAISLLQGGQSVPFELR